jgi:hypothetical protein
MMGTFIKAISDFMRSEPTKNNALFRFGFRYKKGGVHTARTIMLEDLKLLLSCISSPNASKNPDIFQLKTRGLELIHILLPSTLHLVTAMLPLGLF